MIIPNGVIGLKGHTIDLDNIDSVPTWFSRWPIEKQKREAVAFNDRYKVVETCGTCTEPLIAEEVLAHKMAHVPSRSRAFVRTIMALPVDIRDETLKYVGELV